MAKAKKFVKLMPFCGHSAEGGTQKRRNSAGVENGRARAAPVAMGETLDAPANGGPVDRIGRMVRKVGIAGRGLAHRLVQPFQITKQSLQSR